MVLESANDREESHASINGQQYGWIKIAKDDDNVHKPLPKLLLTNVEEAGNLQD